MTHGSLFSGIGGFDLAAEWMGWQNKFHCEWNEFGQRVLHHYWPHAELFTDITKSNFKKYANQIDVLTGGFPCQPYSAAGKRLGKEDERHLWPEMLRAIREIAPSYVVGENVRGLTNWNGGLVFDEVCADLENLGYQVAPYLIPACAVNAPHKRERIWFVAYNQHNGNRRREQQQESEQKTNRASENTGSNGCSNGEYDKQISKRNEWEFSTGGKERIFTCEALQNAPNTDSDGFNQRDCEHEIEPSQRGINALDDAYSIVMHTNGDRLQRGGETNESTFSRSEFEKSITSIQQNGFENFPTQSPICGGDDGLPSQLDGITFSKWRNESIKAYGNAVVPQVVYQLFKAIECYETIRHRTGERTSP